MMSENNSPNQTTASNGIKEIDAQISQSQAEYKAETDTANRYRPLTDKMIFEAVEAHPLTETAFMYGILYFTWCREKKCYIPSSLSMAGINQLLHEAGFAKRALGENFILVHINGCVINRATPEMVKNYLMSCVKGIKDDVRFEYENKPYAISRLTIEEIFLRNSNNICNGSWLEQLQIHQEPILKDTATEAFFTFLNTLVTVSKTGITCEDLQNITGVCIWEEQVIKRYFTTVNDCTSAKYYQFILNVTNGIKEPERLRAMRTGNGYMAHHYFNESEGQAVILYDQSVTDTQNPMGGSGKGLIVSGQAEIRNVAKIDGKHYSNDNRFRLDSVKPTSQIIWYDDVRSDYDFSTLHSALTNGYTIEKKNRPQLIIEQKDNPKTVICSNSIIKGGGTTNKRRQFIIELTDFYSKQIINGNEKPIEETHGGLFFSSAWDANEWDMFYCTMFGMVQEYLLYGLVPFKGINVEYNRLRQSAGEDFTEWLKEKEKEFTRGCDRQATKQHYQNFIETYCGDNHKIAQKTFTGYLKDFATYKGWELIKSESNSISYFQFK